MTASRWYVRCVDCLSVVAVEVPVTQPGASHAASAARDALAGATCDACGGKIEIMGRVERDRMVTAEYDAPACDARCTHARGPSCDCSCGGENHGRAVTVRVVVEQAAPRVMVPTVERAKRTAAEWRAELARVACSQPGRVAALHASGVWVSRADWSLADRYREIVRGARKLRTHAGRMAALSRVQETGIGRVMPAAPAQAVLL